MVDKKRRRHQPDLRLEPATGALPLSGLFLRRKGFPANRTGIGAAFSDEEIAHDLLWDEEHEQALKKTKGRPK